MKRFISIVMLTSSITLFCQEDKLRLQVVMEKIHKHETEILPDVTKIIHTLPGCPQGIKALDDTFHVVFYKSLGEVARGFLSINSKVCHYDPKIIEQVKKAVACIEEYETLKQHREILYTSQTGKPFIPAHRVKQEEASFKQLKRIMNKSTFFKRPLLSLKK